jgi:hypothetical protein
VKGEKLPPAQGLAMSGRFAILNIVTQTDQLREFVELIARLHIPGELIDADGAPQLYEAANNIDVLEDLIAEARRLTGAKPDDLVESPTPAVT